jgi:hypothetical protein
MTWANYTSKWEVPIIPPKKKLLCCYNFRISPFVDSRKKVELIKRRNYGNLLAEL